MSIIRTARALATSLVIALVLALGLTAINAGAASAATGDWTRVAKTEAGTMRSKVVGSTAGGGEVTGSYTPVRFVKRHGKVFVKGFLEGVVEHPGGRVEQFSGMERMRVKRINGAPATARDARVSCEILSLVLAPLDLDVLGLQVHLDRVVLTIVAVGGSGQLLGNLLCAVAGLLDGGLSGALGRLTTLLNRILGLLNLGV